ncbi:hypothetical protein OG21DRAFT_1485711 [Imleria badia]|nr:hypothetical protein OG21DRAFT_1485711 [Imleria badia]
MVLLIKNKHASFEDVAHLSISPAGDTPNGRLAKLPMQSLRNAGVPKAKSLPHINLLAEGGSLKAHCSAVLNADLRKLKPKELIVGRVKSAKDNLRQLFDGASLRQRAEPARGSSDSISTEPACSTTASNVGTSGLLDSSSSLAVSVPAPLDEQDEDEDHIHRLISVAQSWLDFERLFSRRRARSDQTIDSEEARHDFCQALVQSFSDHSLVASPPQAPQSSSNLADLPSFRPICSPTGYSPAPSATTLMDQTAVTLHLFDSTVQEKPAQSPEFSDEELRREFDEFSFHSSQEEDWTSEVESRKQNAMNRALSGMKRQLAVPVPRLSSYVSDDSLADSAAHRTLVNPQPACSSVFSEDDNSSSYSADQEDEVEEDSKSVSLSITITPPDSPVCSATLVVDVAIIPTCSTELLLSSQMDDPTSDEEQDDPEPRAELLEDGTDNVWEVLATYVPRLLTRISEEPLAVEYEIHATAQPPVSFKRQRTTLLDHMDQADSTPAATLAEGTGSSGATSSNAGPPLVATTGTEDDPISSSVLNPTKTLRRVRKFMDLKNQVMLPTVQSKSSIETMCETISLHEEACPPDPQGRRVRRVPGCLDLRRAFGGTDISIKTPPSPSTISEYSIETPGRRFSFGERQRSSVLEEGHEVQPVSPRCHPLVKDWRAKPPIPPKSSGFHLHRKRIQPSTAAVQEPSSLCSRCDPLSSLPLWSCAKITRSKGKQGRPLGESTKALKKRLDSVRIDPETIHGHPPPRRGEKLPSIPSINESRKTKTSKTGKLEKTRSKATAQNVEKQKIFKSKNAISLFRPLPW